MIFKRKNDLNDKENLMRNKRRWSLLGLLLVALMVFGACSNDDKVEDTDIEGNINIVTSFTIIEDMAHQIAKDKANVYNLVPTGTDPHEYEPLPDDIKKAEDADVLFLNGMNLEGGESGWFYKMVDSVNQKEENVFELNEGVTPKYLTDEAEQVEEINPHSFLDPQVGIIMAENLRDALIKVDPDNKDEYEKNAEEYLKELNEIDKLYQEEINSIPKERRILVTSERAFQYMTERYGLDEAYVWEIDTEELGTPEQIKGLIETIREKNPPVLFLESNVDKRPLETVSNETGVKIYDEAIYSDEIGQKGYEADTYVKLLKHNIRIIKDGLSE